MYGITSASEGELNDELVKHINNIEDDNVYKQLKEKYHATYDFDDEMQTMTLTQGQIYAIESLDFSGIKI